MVELAAPKPKLLRITSSFALGTVGVGVAFGASAALELGHGLRWEVVQWAMALLVSCVLLTASIWMRHWIRIAMAWASIALLAFAPFLPEGGGPMPPAFDWSVGLVWLFAPIITFIVGLVAKAPRIIWATVAYVAFMPLAFGALLF